MNVINALQRNGRTLIVVHCAATLFMVGLIWTIHYVHYPLFAYVGETTYVDFQDAHVERIGRLLFAPWLIEAVTLAGVLAGIVAQIAILCTLGILLFMPLWDKRNQNIWDKVSGTYVVNDPTDTWQTKPNLVSN